jgi:hypothetical protein
VVVRSKRFLISLMICDICVIISLLGMSIPLLEYHGLESIRVALCVFMLLSW